MRKTGVKKTDQLILDMEHANESRVRVVFDLFVATGFLCVIGCLYVAFAVLLGKYELLVLSYVLLAAACVRSLLTAEQRQKLEKVAVIGEGVKIFNRLEAYYLTHPPRSMVYYLLFPITGILSFFFSKERGRQELKAYWGLIQWIIVLLVVGGVASYHRMYKHFDWRFSVTWLYMELLAIYFLCNFFAVPLSTTSLNFSLKQKRIRLFTTSFISLVVLSLFLYVFGYRSNYENLIPINIMLDKRLAELKREYYRPKSPKPAYLAVLEGEKQKTYFERIHHATLVFLRFQAPRILTFNQQYLLAPDQDQRRAFFEQLNEAYQKQLSPLATLGEHQHIYMTFTQEPKEFWGILCIPFRESIFTIVHYKHRRLTIYRRWVDLPFLAQQQMLSRWDRNAFVFSKDKRMAQLVVEFMREKFQQAAETMNQLAPPSQPQVAPPAADSATTPKKESMPKSQAVPVPPPSPVMPPAGAPYSGRKRMARRYKRSPKRKQSAKPTAGARRRGADNLQNMTRPAKPTAPPSVAPSPSMNLPARPTPADSDMPRVDASTPQAVRRQMRQLKHVWRQLMFDMHREFGLPLSTSAKSQARAFFEMWPRPWIVPGISELLKGTVAHDKRIQEMRGRLARMEQQMQSTSRSPEPSAPTSPRIVWRIPKRNAATQAQLRRMRRALERAQRAYQRTRSMYQWSQIKRLRQTIATLEGASNTTNSSPAPRAVSASLSPQETQQLRSDSAYLAGFVQRLQGLRQAVWNQWQQVRPYRRQYSVYNDVMSHFDYPRALGARLLYDHFGKTPTLVQTWWTIFYEKFLMIVMLLFQLTMPLHIAMVFYCQVRLSDVGLAASLGAIVGAAKPGSGGGNADGGAAAGGASSGIV